jgi:GAF domain-containing protein
MEEAEFLSQMALELNAELTMQSTAELITEYARITTAADDSGLLFMRTHRSIETVAATSPRVIELHQQQDDIEEGPGLAALHDETSYLVVDTETDERFPSWGPRAAKLGIRSALSIRLESITRTYGTLNLYGEAVGAFGQTDLTIGQNFARHASIALSSAYVKEGLQIAIDARTFVGQAQGILMGRYGISAERAFEYLRRRSQQENVKLGDIAHEVIEKIPDGPVEAVPDGPVDPTLDGPAVP